MTATAATTATTVDDAEVARFSRIAAEWWNPAGKFRPLHKFNPVRLGYLKDRVTAHFGRDPNDPKGFAGLDVLDIGCGGGLVSEPLARLGADVTGADASETNIEVARLHARESGLTIDYRATTAEALAAEGRSYDVVLALEIVEHVADVPLFLGECARMVRPGGLLVVATLNRTAKAFALAVVGAEYVLGWLPRGTHDWRKFVTPKEIEAALAPTGVAPRETIGVVFDPLTGRWKTHPRDTDVNYMVLAARA